MAFTLRTDAELDAALTALAESQGVSKQEVIRRAILEKYAQAGARDRLDTLTTEMVGRWGDVLDRLGDV